MSASARQAIIRYLSQHPDSMDTLQGVMEWWLRNDVRTWSPAEVTKALRSLVEESLVSEVTGADGQVRYGLSKRPRHTRCRPDDR